MDDEIGVEVCRGAGQTASIWIKKTYCSVPGVVARDGLVRQRGGGIHIGGCCRWMVRGHRLLPSLTCTVISRRGLGRLR